MSTNEESRLTASAYLQAARTASVRAVYLVMHTRLQQPFNLEVDTAQASSARPAELQGSLRMNNISSRRPPSAGRCCSAAGRDEMNLQSMRRIPDSPANEDHTVTMSVLSVH
ncbi:Hypothetical predicted protein [Xyrichtys novacula]|uniref:Uncharacterized protein n=1 Tax=Xyrichtys novacula TaxID=13765 RepID=A0AAV1GIV2_XYRNO|nr:Hypothetical predicted protein [Xyrichtys novacula]